MSRSAQDGQSIYIFLNIIKNRVYCIELKHKILDKDGITITTQ